MDGLLGGWLLAVVVIGAAKVAGAPVAASGPAEAMVMMLPFVLVALAPVVAYYLSSAAFPRGQVPALPSLRLSGSGRWRELDVDAAQKNPAFGPMGLMASLIAGILINVPVRCLEYVGAVPAMAHGVPSWAHSIAFAMTVDAVAMSFCYMVCFVLALRSVPMFPRMLVLTWALDIMMQFGIAHQVSTAPHLPPAVAAALSQVLHGNVQKVLISVCVWLPYLIVSKRVNVTFRRRVRV